MFGLLIKALWLQAFLQSRISELECVCIWSFSDPYFPAFELSTETYGVSHCIQSECRKIRTWKTPNMDSFYAVSSCSLSCYPILSWHLLIQSQQLKRYSNVWIMFKVSNKEEIADVVLLFLLLTSNILIQTLRELYLKNFQYWKYWQSKSDFFGKCSIFNIIHVFCIN